MGNAPKTLDNALVRYSRAGDAFHYRWAARRCLRMIDPRSALRCIKVESSNEPSAAGEYVIDLAEYSKTETYGETVEYYQLKHSTVRSQKEFTLAEMKGTIAAFAKRYFELFTKRKVKYRRGSVRFWFVTNRPISEFLKQGIKAIGSGSKAIGSLQTDLERITLLKGRALRAFSCSLNFVDGEGDYIVQKERLHGEMAEYIAGFIDSQEVEKLISLISDRALPHSNGEIHREDVLQRLGVTSDRGLFPAQPVFEKLAHVIKREQHASILKHILSSARTTIIHAEGGVGKSVVAQQIAKSLPAGSIGIVYDCFGGGKYRNASEPRHRACDALVQIANELATRGLCRPLIGHQGTPTDALFRDFLQRIEQASNSLREVTRNAVVVLLIDAADNAEMAALENGDRCFVSALLLETLPFACRLVALCRTERIDLVHAPITAHRYLLKPFSKLETAYHLRQFLPATSDNECLEFHRLTGGNPRVQANALASRHRSVDDLLASLGPSGTTVNDQIAEQLHTAVSGLKDKNTANFKKQVEAICCGLANLPPFVPIEVLAKTAGVEVSAVKSLVSDLGRPLWHSDNSVQFRDEPTETWFRQQFGAEKAQIREYARALEPLATEYSYVAKALPQLLLNAEDYDRLISLALSDEFLPENNPIDARDTRVYRLQFAFKAALKLRRLADAARLAFRAGEEVAGDKRQLELLQANADLIAPLQDEHRVQELAYRQFFKCQWPGSENVYSAALLSSVKDFHGEAQSYVRAATKWLRNYLEERDKIRDDRQHASAYPELLKDQDLAEFAWCHHNLSGAAGAVKFLTSWRPPHVVFRIARIFVRRLIDAARFDEIDEIAHVGYKNLYLILAIADELMSVGCYPPQKTLRHSLDLLIRQKMEVRKAAHSHFDDTITPAIISLIEASAARGLPRNKIKTVLEGYTAPYAHDLVAGNFQEIARRTFLRGVALRTVLARNFTPDTKSLLPPQDNGNKRAPSEQERENKELTQIIGALLPWHIVRARLLARDPDVHAIDLEEVQAQAKSSLHDRFRSYDPIPFEISRVRFEVLALKRSVTTQEIENFRKGVIAKAERKFLLPDRLDALRAACRLEHLISIRAELEESCSSSIEQAHSEGPEERSGWFIILARAVMSVSRSDASAYFADAVDAVSKFGDEVVDRWLASVAVAERASVTKQRVPELCYRFVRCGEMVGDTVAKEKYWNRDQVFSVATRLDLPGAFAALSRWRDRDVGCFSDQLKALATTAVETDGLPALSSWCLSGFQGCNGSGDYAALCIRKETTTANRQQILKAAIRDLELAGASLEAWDHLEAASSEFRLENRQIRKLIAISSKENATDLDGGGEVISQGRRRLNHRRISWKRFLQKLNLLTPEGLSEALKSFREMDPWLGSPEIWNKIIERVPAGKEREFLSILATAEDIEIYDIGNALDCIQRLWSKKAAVRRGWPSFANAIGRRFAVPLATGRQLNYWLRACRLDEGTISSMMEGIIEGFAESSELLEASTFFGFVGIIASRLSADDAFALLDFSISRFEKHIPTDYGDGPWTEGLKAPPESSGSMAGMIWSALGSPHATIRWQAAHCVRRLAENCCEAEIASLVTWMLRGGVGPFGNRTLPFYNLHAKQYLLLAFARVAMDTADILKTHAKVFAEIALKGMPHILIQKTAAEVALSLERAYPGSYDSEIVAKLGKVGKSPFPAKEVNDYGNNEESPWHLRGEVNLNLKLHFGFDFDRYWFQPLGNVFGIPENQVVELARKVAVSEMNISGSDEYAQDPRQSQWNSWNSLHGRQSRATWADHGDYPRIDNYGFYYSYHSVLAVAAQLISNIPVIRQKHRDYEEDRWHHWLSRHSLTRSDGRWLADRRDPSPIKRRKWVKDRERENWLWGVSADDFIDCLRQQSTSPQSICVNGWWSECRHDLIETVRITSALVHPHASNALANALRSCENPHRFSLSSRSSSESDFTKAPFELTGWITDNDTGGSRLDFFDPYAREIGYPPDEVKSSIAALLELSADAEGREWRLPRAKEPALICQVWSDKKTAEVEEPFPFGQRITASIALLKMLCWKTSKELIFNVEIRRERHRSYGSSRDDDDDVGYVLPSHKIFILSANGILRDKEKSYQLR
jgi:hypothetical protein